MKNYNYNFSSSRIFLRVIQTTWQGKSNLDAISKLQRTPLFRLLSKNFYLFSLVEIIRDRSDLAIRNPLNLWFRGQLNSFALCTRVHRLPVTKFPNRILAICFRSSLVPFGSSPVRFVSISFRFIFQYHNGVIGSV